jgi:hypothetical protein
LTAVDEIYVEQTSDGHVTKHLCRVRVFFLSFLTGMPVVELGVNDMTRDIQSSFFFHGFKNPNQRFFYPCCMRVLWHK